MRRLLAGILIMGAVLAVMPGCATMGAQQRESVMTTLREWEAAMESLDIDRLMETYSEDYVEWTLGDKTGVRQFYTKFGEAGYLDNAEVSLDAVEIKFLDGKAIAWPVVSRAKLGTRSYEMTLVNEDGVWRITSVDTF